MSTDHKKMVKTIVMAYFLGCMFLLAGMQMSYALLPVFIFTTIAIILFFTSILSLHKQYKKYHIPIYIFLELVGAGLIIFSIIIAYASQI